jgi:hypothetical protein
VRSEVLQESAGSSQELPEIWGARRVHEGPKRVMRGNEGLQRALRGANEPEVAMGDCRWPQGAMGGCGGHNTLSGAARGNREPQRVVRCLKGL